MEAPKPKPLTECEGILVKLDPSPYDLRRAVLALEKRIEKLEADLAAKNTPAEAPPPNQTIHLGTPTLKLGR